MDCKGICFWLRRNQAVTSAAGPGVLWCPDLQAIGVAGPTLDQRGGVPKQGNSTVQLRFTVLPGPVIQDGVERQPWVRCWQVHRRVEATLREVN
ncbi:hypothetical protein NDU88_010862 [Pleurodeles waltl]|uniref:Uncharacterized protein n=1 Tax=Pleurodeles waltl TaxID=8319 RepID=A0AAV7Q366_PLEWA|nr:hypothetical protein NDU88_010862 [Pleurodeles waltl]